MEWRNEYPVNYDAWMVAVDAEVYRRVGCSVYDLADAQTKDMYEDDMTPAQAAKRIISGGD